MVRIKHRYLLVNILYPDNNLKTNHKDASFTFNAPTPPYVDAGRIVGHIRASVSLMYGDFGMGVCASSLKIVYWSAATSTLILRVPYKHHRLVWSSLTHLTELPSPQSNRRDKAKGGYVEPLSKPRTCVFQVVRVSGTIRKAEQELIRRARMEVVRAVRLQQGKGDRSALNTAMLENDLASGLKSEVAFDGDSSMEDDYDKD